MPCIIDSGYSLGCFSAAGARRVLIATYDGAATFESTTDDSIIEAITTSSTFFVYEQEIETASLSQTVSVNRQGGSVKFEQTVSLALQGLSPEVRGNFESLAKAPLHVILEDANGQYWLVGQENGARVSTAEFSTGVAMDDNVGATLELLGVEGVAARSVDPSLIADLLAVV